MKDVDNIPKGILDGMAGKLYRDDRQVQHLDLIRVSSPDERGFVMVRVAATELSLNRDVVSMENLKFVNPEVIDIAAFLGS